MNHKFFDFLEGKLHMTQLKLSPIFVKPIPYSLELVGSFFLSDDRMISCK